MTLISNSNVSDFRQICYIVMLFVTVVKYYLYHGVVFGHIVHQCKTKVNT